MFVVLQCGEVADEDALGAAAFDEFQVAFLARLEDARGGDENFRTQGHCFFVATWVFEVAINVRHAAFHRGFELFHRATEHAQLRQRVGGLAAVLWQQMGIVGHRANGWLGFLALFIERLHELTTQAIEFRYREMARAGKLVVETGEFVIGIAEPRELGVQGFRGKRMLFRYAEFLCRVDGVALAGEA